ncbi:MAG: hypothetical protein GTO18_11905 [Anaerolineales bacterium]|nr:hypothetical protein [Anaerolineales bacterium]
MSDNGSIASGLKVGIVGGSIAGSVAAIELSRIGCEVMVFERSKGHFEDRGAGIASSYDHLNLLKERDLLDEDYPYVSMDGGIWTIPSDDDRFGRVIWRNPAAAGGMNWGVLFANHRKRVPEGIYHAGCSIVDLVVNEDGSVRLVLEDGCEFEFDLVIFADGYHSWGRNYLYPEAEMEYAGYVIWRGLIDESQVPDGMFDTESEWAVHEDGLCIFYMIPGQNGEHEQGKRRVNWAWYNVVPEGQLNDLLTDKYGRLHETSLPQGGATEEHVKHIHDRARQKLRGVAADVICATEDPFIQVIYDLHVPSYVRGRICLIGDASSIARPHTGAGAIKAQQQAIALSKALSTHESLDSALRAWDDEVWDAGDKQVSLGKVLGRALVTEAPDWNEMDEDRMAKWWGDATSGVYVYYFDDATSGEKTSK